MKTSIQVRCEFEAKLKNLLAEFDAEMETKGYDSISVTIPAIYDETGTLREYTEFKLGTWIAANTLDNH